MIPLARRALAEFVGTAFLVAAIIGSGIAAVRLSPHDVGLQLLENSIITGGALVALILALQPVSAAFNPIVTVVERALGGLTSGDAALLILAQLTGGIAGAMLANLMFDLPALNLSTHHRSGHGLWLGEVVATAGIDITAEAPKLLTNDAVSEADVVVTMGCGAACPYYPGKRYLDWPLTDPAGQPIEVVRQVRDEIRQRVTALMAELLDD